MPHMLNNLNIGLKGFELLQSSSDHKLTLHVKLKKKYDPKSCSHCSTSKLYPKGNYLRRVKHLKCFEQPCLLIIHTHRWQCCSCSKSFIPNLPGITKGRHSSEPLRKHIYDQHHDGICTKTIADRLAMGQATVSRIYSQFTLRKAKERLSENCPHVLGIDEHTLHKKQKFSTTLCDLKNHKVFDVVAGRSNQDLNEYFTNLQGKEKVRVVCIDLSSPYRKLIHKQMPFPKLWCRPKWC